MSFDSINLTERFLQPELMDEPGLEPREHIQALRALARVNLLSLTTRRIWKALPHSGNPSGGPLRVLDVACGGGDVVLALKETALRVGVEMEVSGCDISPVALSHARSEAARRGLDAHFFSLDVAREPIPGGFDLVASSLFLHHLDEGTGVNLLAGLAAAGRVVAVQDLVRSRLGYWLAKASLKVLSSSRVAQVDGPRSVRAAFRIPEVRALAERGGLEGAVVIPCWPERFLLTWQRS